MSSIFFLCKSSFDSVLRIELQELIFSPVTNSAGEPEPKPLIPLSNSSSTKTFSTESIVSYAILYGLVNSKFSDHVFILLIFI